MQARLTLAEADLAVLQRLAELRTLDDIRTAEVVATAKEVAGLRASLERLATLVVASPVGARDKERSAAPTQSGYQPSAAGGSRRKRRPATK